MAQFWRMNLSFWFSIIICIASIVALALQIYIIATPNFMVGDRSLSNPPYAIAVTSVIVNSMMSLTLLIMCGYAFWYAWKYT